MKRKTEKQDQPPVDRFLLVARIARLDIDQKRLAELLDRDPSAVTRALAGENDTVLRRLDRKVSYLERRKQSKKNTIEQAAQS